MSTSKLDQIADQLRQSGEYRVIHRYRKPESYNVTSPNDKKLIGVFLDIESTGLSHTIDKLLELGMVKFEYTEDGRILNLLEEFNGYQDPKIPIPEHITKLTGINNDMVKNHSIENSKVAEYLEDVDIIISHNAQFDKAFFETAFPDIVPKAWACSMRNINWSNEDISSFKLEYIAYRYNFFYEGHRAIIDCLAGIHVLAQNLLNSKQLVLKHLLDNALQLEFRLWAKDAPYDCKDLLKARSYRWGTHPINNFKSWYVEILENNVEEEINYLRSSIYGRTIDIPIDILDAFSKYSINNQLLEKQDKYKDKLTWVQTLCKVQ